MILDRPPEGWKRPPIPCRVKLQVVLNQGGRSLINGEKLIAIEDVHFDHRPALWERRFDTATQDTVPPANDPAHIEAITIEQHDIRTHGPGGEKRITTKGSDSGNRALDRRVIAAESKHRDNMTAKARGDEPRQPRRGAGFGKRKMPKGRKFPKRTKA
jgi:hypothetical protein